MVLVLSIIWIGVCIKIKSLIVSGRGEVLLNPLTDCGCDGGSGLDYIIGVSCVRGSELQVMS